MPVKRIKIHENLLRVIAAAEDYAIIFMDTDGIIRSWNRGAQKINGYKKKEIIGKSFKCLYTEEDLKSSKPDILCALAMRYGRATDEGWRVRKDGSLFWASVVITAAHDESGQIVGFGKLTKDLTERKMAEQAYKLEVRNKELEQFNYIASHDLLEPLRTVSNFIKLLEEDFGPQLSEQSRYYLDAIGSSANRMAILVKALLEYSRIGRVQEFKSVDLNKVLEEVLEDLENLIHTSSAKINSDQLPVILGSETELRQLFQNLIDNAIKFRKNDEPLEIRIGYRESFSEHEFFIRDNGIGIDPKNSPKIFQIFQRLNLESQYPGYGIGLANCKKITEVHNGKIWVESKVGEGCTFRFTISKFLE